MSYINVHNRIIITVKCAIDSRDRGLRKLYAEYQKYKRDLIPQVQEAVREVVKDRRITVYAQQKWMVDRKLTRYLRNLPFHPMPFHNQSVYVEHIPPGFLLHLKTKMGEAVCRLIVPRKYKEHLAAAAGKGNPAVGQVELIEDLKYGRMNAHITLRLPKPKPYAPHGWVGVDVGWNCLAVSALVTQNAISAVTFHGKKYKTSIIQLKHLRRQHQRAGKAMRKWRLREQQVTRQAVGYIAKEIVRKARRHRAGVAMEDLTFRSRTKRWLIPRYKLKQAVKTLCERRGIPYAEVSPYRTSITCSRCGHIDRRSRVGKNFKCTRCGYQLNADLNAAVNVGRAANAAGYTPTAKESGATRPADGGQVASPVSPPTEATPPPADAERANPRKGREDP